MVGCPSVCLSVPSIDSGSGVQRVCCWARARAADIDRSLLPAPILRPASCCEPRYEAQLVSCRRYRCGFRFILLTAAGAFCINKILQFYWRCQLTQVDLYKGRKTVVGWFHVRLHVQSFIWTLRFPLCVAYTIASRIVFMNGWITGHTLQSLGTFIFNAAFL